MKNKVLLLIICVSLLMNTSSNLICFAHEECADLDRNVEVKHGEIIVVPMGPGDPDPLPID